VLKTIVETTAHFISTLGWPLDLIVAVPPSRLDRPVLPSIAVAEGVAEHLQIPVCSDCVMKVKETPELKNLRDRQERLKALEGAYRASQADLSGKRILLIDDLYRSGATLGAVTNALYNSGQAEEVYAVTLTKTRRLR
jgi:predicted amidophosphoribosyltransferase